MTRVLDIFASTLGLIFFGPFVGIILLLVWKQDGYSPLYRGERVGKNKRIFRIIKIRSMHVDADRSGIESTSATDHRITPIGHFVRRWKFDEVLQLWNVLKGDMGLVGPRPNTIREVEKYSEEELKLLIVRPGITDIASIVFSDEGQILGMEEDPEEAYNNLIRPWKSRLGLLYIEKKYFLLDVCLIFLTVVSIFRKPLALRLLHKILVNMGAPDDLVSVSYRKTPLKRILPSGDFSSD